MREKKKRAQEKPGDYLKNAEMAMEGNYNMVDGVINNTVSSGDDLTDGQSWDEMRNLAPETLPEARPEKKPSVREALKRKEKRPPSSGRKAQARDDMSL